MQARSSGWRAPEDLQARESERRRTNISAPLSVALRTRISARGIKEVREGPRKQDERNSSPTIRSARESRRGGAITKNQKAEQRKPAGPRAANQSGRTDLHVSARTADERLQQGLWTSSSDETDVLQRGRSRPRRRTRSAKLQPIRRSQEGDLGLDVAFELDDGIKTSLPLL